MGSPDLIEPPDGGGASEPPDVWTTMSDDEAGGTEAPARGTGVEYVGGARGGPMLILYRSGEVALRLTDSDLLLLVALVTGASQVYQVIK